ncbi:early nodulin-75-like isoform X2 [Penaeus japonicus]|uniref:early nodulin-75-like isoform X2 n=1 Tax=Penaeus japonicus TaxID=27405 RepID=UPI001C7165C5|nr:early nodulin-75-like isoform X2 [Penaeus japonicus]
MLLISLKLTLLLVFAYAGHVEGSGGDQDADESAWSSYGWSEPWYHDGPNPAPLDRPRKRHLGVGEEEVDAAPLYVVWEDLPLLAKEGVTLEEARWVPEYQPLRVIKESYTSGSREFDHSFRSLGFVDHHASPVYIPQAPHVPEVLPHVHEDPPHEHEVPHVPEHVPDIQPYVAEAPHEPEPPVYVPQSPPVAKVHAGPPPPQYSVHPGLPRKYYLTEEGQQDHKRVPGVRKYYLLDAQGGGGGGHPREELPLELPPATESEVRLQEHLSEVGPPSNLSHPPPHPPPPPHTPHIHPTYSPTHPGNGFGHPPPYPPIYYPPHTPEHYPPPTPPTIRKYYLNSRHGNRHPTPAASPYPESQDRILELEGPVSDLSSFELRQSRSTGASTSWSYQRRGHR